MFLGILGKGGDMKKLWITYAWSDDEEGNVDYIIHELDKYDDIEIKFDKRNLIPGQRLWQQIGGIITDIKECDAWGILLTKNSIRSEACIEELSYALDRAISSNCEGFPIFALLKDIDITNVPPSLRVRLCIPLENNDFKVQVHSAVYKQPSGYTPKNLSDWIITLRKDQDTNLLTFEFRPRFDRIIPYSIAVDFEENINGNVLGANHGPSGGMPNAWNSFNRVNSEAILNDGTKVWIWGAENEINPAISMYLRCKTIPKRLWYGSRKRLLLLNLADKESYAIEE